MAAKTTDKIKPMIVKGIYDQLRSNVNEDTYYAAVAIVDDSEYKIYSGSDSDNSEFYGGDNLTEFDIKDELYYARNTISLHRVLPGGISRVVKRINWIQNTVYNSWDEGGNYYVLTLQYLSGIPRLNVYKCLYSTGEGSSTPPVGTSTSPIQTSDGYWWLYMYTIGNSEAIRFLTEDWMPCPERVTNADAVNIQPGTTKALQYTQQQSAIRGTVFNIVFNDGFTISDDSEYLIYGDDETLGSDVEQIFKGRIYGDDGPQFELTQYGKGYISQVVVKKDETDSEVENITTHISPDLGHGSNSAEELEAYHIMITVRNVPDPDGDILYILQNQFKMLNLIRNPIDRLTNNIAEKDLYYACNSFYDSEGKFTKDNIIYSGTEDTPNYKEGRVVSVYKGSNDLYNRVFYINHKSNLPNTFNVGETIVAPGGSVTLTTANSLERDWLFASGEIVISDFRAEFTQRTNDQIESLNFIIGF